MNKQQLEKITRQFIPLIIVASCGVILDRITKNIALANLKFEGDYHTIIKNFFSFQLAYNTGGAWSIMSDQLIFFYIFVPIAIIVIAVVYYKSKSAVIRFCLSLIMAGAIGNFIDRLVYQYVIDFLRFHPFDFPIFNVADIFVVCGSLLLMFYLMFEERLKKDE